MVDALDLLRCPVCGAFYKPVTTETGRLIPHCQLEPDFSRGQLAKYEWLHGEVEIDWAAAEARLLADMGLTDVVDPPLTVPKKGFKMFGLRLWEILLLVALAAFLIWVDSAPANGACLMSYCKDKAPTRSYITNTHRQIVGDLYKPGPRKRIQIRNKHRQIIGYIILKGVITNLRRQKKGRINE